MQSTKKVIKKRRNYTLKELRKKSDAYFRQSAIIEKGRRTNKQIEYIVTRTFEALPENVKKYLSKDETIKNMVNNIIVMKDQDFNPSALFREMARSAKRRAGDGTKEDIWRRFIHEYFTVYRRYYGYMKRYVFSPKDYWFENVDITQSGSTVYCECELINRPNPLYTMLYIEYDYSGEEFQAYLL
jgi:hypothetical protein